MLFIYKKRNENGSYPPLQSINSPSVLSFPDEFIPIFYPAGKRSFGFVTITDDGETVTSCEWNEEAYQKWCAENPEPDYLAEAKAARIAQSKADLAAYLECHPLQWTDGEYYSITAEKQAQLTSTLVCAQADGQPPEWNSTGGVCREWDVQELTALGVAIKDRVKALVKYQQTQEVTMRNAVTPEELEAIVVDYDSVSEEVSA